MIVNEDMNESAALHTNATFKGDWKVTTFLRKLLCIKYFVCQHDHTVHWTE